MALLGIDHSKMSQYLSIRGMNDNFTQRYSGVAFDPTAKEVFRIFDEYSSKIDHTRSSTNTDGTIINEYLPLYELVRASKNIDNLPTKSIDYTKLSAEDNAAMQQELNKIGVGDKSLRDIKYQDFMQTFKVEQSKATGKMYLDYLMRLARDSEEGANDKIINLTVDSQGKIRYGKLIYDNLNLNDNPDLSPGNLRELELLMINLKQENMAEEMTGNKGFDLMDLSNNPEAIRRLARINEEFRETIKSNSFATNAENVNFYINIGDPNDNVFLADWLNARKIEGAKRLGDIVSTRNLENMSREDIDFKQSVEDVLSKDGFLYSPESYTIVDKEGKALDLDTVDQSTYEKWHGIVSAFYFGSNKTKRITRNNESIPITVESMEQIIGAYESRGFGIKPDMLFKDETYQVMFENRAYENLGLKNEHIRIIKNLEENGLAVRTEDGIELNNDEAIRNLILEEPGLDLTEYTKYATDILNAIGGEGKYIKRSGALEFDFASNQEVNIEALKNIHKMIPEIYNKEISKTIGKLIVDGKLKFNHEQATWTLNSMSEHLKKGEFDSALKALEDLSGIIDADTYNKIKDTINNAITDKDIALKVTKELAPDSGTAYEAINSMINQERLASQSIERKLMEILNGSAQQRMDSITNYMSLMDTLTKLYKGDVKKASVPDLFNNFLKTRNYKDLVELIQGATQSVVGKNMPTNLDNSHMVNAFEHFLNQTKQARHKDKLSIANEYGLVSSDGQIRTDVFAHLKRREFQEVKDLITNENPDYLTKTVDDRTLDENLFYLSWISNNVDDVPIIKLREKLIPNTDGTMSTIQVREWVSAADNSEFITPSHKAVKGLNDKGIELYYVAKSTIIGGRHENISRVNEIEKIFNQTTIDIPSDKYLTKPLKENGVLDPDDLMQANAQLPEGNTRYIEVSFGRPLAFVENPGSVRSLNKEYKSWYNKAVQRIQGKENAGILETGTLENFKQVFNPKFSIGIPSKIQALYISEMNTAAFDNTWMPTNIKAFNGPKGHYGTNIKMLKYIKLGEGGSMKMLPDRSILTELNNKIINGDINLPADRVRSLENILNDLTNYELKRGGLKIGVLDDEYDMGYNTLLIRERVKYDAENQIKDADLKKHMIDKYSNLDNFKAILDKSAIDGAIYIDKDMRNLFLTLLAENNYINGFKGSMAQSGNEVEYILMGKGLFIFDPRHAQSMKKQNIRFLAGQSALKNISGISTGNMPISGYVSKEGTMRKTIRNMSDDNMMYTNLDGLGIRFNGHITAGAAVPHPWAHYQSKDNAIVIREGFMNLSNTIEQIQGFSNNLNDGAIPELADALNNFKRENKNVYEATIEDWSQMMLNLGLNTRNETLRKAIIKTWEDKALPEILKPANENFANPFVAPDLEASNPLQADLYVKNDQGYGYKKTERSAVRLQLGESTLGYDATQMKVSNIDQLAFAVRVNDVDWIVKYDGKEYKSYTALQDYDEAGYALEGRLNKLSNKIKDKNGIWKNNIPQEVKNVIERLHLILDSKTSTRIHTGSDMLPSFHDVQSYIERGVLGERGFDDSQVNAIFRKKDAGTFKNIDKYKLSLVVLNERGPRKSVSDFIPTRLRIRNAIERNSIIDAGTMYKVNPFDIAANLQADHDGDKVRFTFDFGEEKFNFLKQSYRTVSVDEEYKVYDAGVREANIFGTQFDNQTGKLAPAGTIQSSEGGSIISKTKKDMINDQRAVGKVIGAQSALQWMHLTDFNITLGNDVIKLNEVLDFSAKNLVENGDIFRRFNKINQSAVDFVNKIDPNIVKDPIGMLLYGHPMEQEYRTRVLDIDKKRNDGVARDIVEQVVNTLKKPSSLFNLIYDEAGGKPATSYNIQEYYADIQRFFRNPNEYILNKLIYKYKNDPNIDLNAKMNEIIPLFFSSENAELYPNNYNDYKEKLLYKRIKPNKSVVKFDGTVDEQINKFNSGYVMDKVVNDKMFKIVELDNAWKHVEMNEYKRSKTVTSEFMEKIHMLRILGVTDEQVISAGDTAFDFGSKNRWVIGNENASLIYDQINYNISNLEGKLEYLAGFKNPNTTEISRVSDRLISAIKSREILTGLKTKKYLEKVGESQITKNITTFRFDQTRRNNSKRDKNVYRITGPLYDGEAINFNNMKFEGTWNKDWMFKFRKNSKYVVLENPMVGHRLSREQSLDGYAWHYTSNTIPRDFVENFNLIERQGLSVSKNIKRIWINALAKFQDNKAQIADIFTYAGIEKKLILDKYFGISKDVDKFNDNRLVKHNNLNFDAEQSSIYYLAKLLLIPDQLQRQFIKGDQELALLRLNERVLKDTFQWLSDNNHQDIAKEIIKEYQGHRDYLMGFTNENTIDLKPSSLYLNKYELNFDKANQPLYSLMSGVLTSDAEMIIRQGYKVKSSYGDNIKEVKGEFNIREVRNEFSKWKEKTIDNRKANCR